MSLEIDVDVKLVARHYRGERGPRSPAVAPVLALDMPELINPTVALHAAWLEAHKEWGPGLRSHRVRSAQQRINENHRAVWRGLRGDRTKPIWLRRTLLD